MMVDLMLNHKDNLHLTGGKAQMVISKTLNNSPKHFQDLVLIPSSLYLEQWADLIIKEEDDQESKKFNMVTISL